MQPAKKTIRRFFLLACLSLMSIAFISAVWGVDSYSIYLNDKLLLRNALDQPLSLESLNLSKASENDVLIIRYRECHAPKTGVRDRSIGLRDHTGKILKTWKFNDGENNAAMRIPVKEILAAEKEQDNLVLFYTSQDLGREQSLAAL